jgi:HNH endonuclease
VNPDYAAVARRARHRCEYCRAPEKLSSSTFEVEHVHPTSRGGGNEAANLALACRSCNTFKADAIAGWDDVTSAEAPLSNPRADRWDEHFSLDPDAGVIVGLTPTGRVTVAQLRFNDPHPLTARLIWIELGIYP